MKNGEKSNKELFTLFLVVIALALLIVVGLIIHARDQLANDRSVAEYKMHIDGGDDIPTQMHLCPDKQYMKLHRFAWNSFFVELEIGKDRSRFVRVQKDGSGQKVFEALPFNLHQGSQKIVSENERIEVWYDVKKKRVVFSRVHKGVGFEAYVQEKSLSGGPSIVVSNRDPRLMMIAWERVNGSLELMLVDAGCFFDHKAVSETKVIKI